MMIAPRTAILSAIFATLAFFASQRLSAKETRLTDAVIRAPQVGESVADYLEMIEAECKKRDHRLVLEFDAIAIKQYCSLLSAEAQSLFDVPGQDPFVEKITIGRQLLAFAAPAKGTITVTDDRIVVTSFDLGCDTCANQSNDSLQE